MSELYLKIILSEVLDTQRSVALNKHEDYSTLQFTAWVCCSYARRHGSSSGCHRALTAGCLFCGVDFERPDEISWQGLHEELKNMQDKGV